MIVVEKKIKCEIGTLFNILNDINKYPYFLKVVVLEEKPTYQKTLMMEF